ncbi:unnamed protein product [Pleuronectes platessa]|uniref:Uncharacterized protein n=1 Tax=Pleuronectes platessa TaxID=8262 RepID=A0A9N7ZEU0_PLEPL|nr:unnamed protein product [Pleuronectes platessa]
MDMAGEEKMCGHPGDATPSVPSSSSPTKSNYETNPALVSCSLLRRISFPASSPPVLRPHVSPPDHAGIRLKSKPVRAEGCYALLQSWLRTRNHKMWLLT